MRTWTTLGAALGIALFLHAPAWAQTLGELSAAQGVGGSVTAAGASGATTARAVRDAITSPLSGNGLSFRHCSNLVSSRPTSFAYSFSLSSPSAVWLANSLAWYGQNLPWAWAQFAASEAGRACGWNGSG